MNSGRYVLSQVLLAIYIGGSSIAWSSVRMPSLGSVISGVANSSFARLSPYSPGARDWGTLPLVYDDSSAAEQCPRVNVSLEAHGILVQHMLTQALCRNADKGKCSLTRAARRQVGDMGRKASNCVRRKRRDR